MNRELAIALDNQIQERQAELQKLIAARNAYAWAWCEEQGYFARMTIDKAMQAMRMAV